MSPAKCSKPPRSSFSHGSGRPLLRQALYVFDLDGTLYRGNEPMPGAAECVARLRAAGAAVRFLTNNSSALPSDVALKLENLGVQAMSGEVRTSAMTAAAFCAAQRLRSLFLVGEAGLAAAIAAAGLATVEDGQTAEAVLVGICRSFNYELLDRAMQHVLGGARLIATNSDATYPLEGGRLAPGAGSMVAALEACTGVKAQVLGKPEPDGLLQLIGEAGVEPAATMVVGDRLETDIEAGRRAGCETFLVLTGVSAELPPRQRGGTLAELG